MALPFVNLSSPPLSPFILLASAVCGGSEFQVCVTWKKKVLPSVQFKPPVLRKNSE